MRFSVQKAMGLEGTKMVGGFFKAVGYQTEGVNFPVESQSTKDQAEAQSWADRASAGEQVPEAKFASYCDD